MAGERAKKVLAMVCLVDAMLLIGGMVNIWSKKTLHGGLALHTWNNKGTHMSRRH